MSLMVLCRLSLKAVTASFSVVLNQRLLKLSFVIPSWESSYRCKDTKNTENVAKKYWINVRNFCTFKRLNGSLLCLFVFVYLYKAVFCASTTLRYLPKEHVVTWWFATCWGPLFCYLLRFVVLLFAGFCSFASCWYGKKRAARFHNHAAQNLNNQ